MKLFKLFIAFIFVFLLFFSFYSAFTHTKKKLDPISPKNDFYLQVNNDLKNKKIETSKDIIRDYQNQLEFYIINQGNPIKIIFSTEKDPNWQTASLQEILKKAKINNQQLQLVDLSINHPYATFKNN